MCLYSHACIIQVNTYVHALSFQQWCFRPNNENFPVTRSGLLAICSWLLLDDVSVEEWEGKAIKSVNVFYKFCCVILVICKIDPEKYYSEVTDHKSHHKSVLICLAPSLFQTCFLSKKEFCLSLCYSYPPQAHLERNTAFPTAFFPIKYSIILAKKLEITKTASQPVDWGSFHRLPLSLRNGMSEPQIITFCL